jgi:glycosyltransferase involved in cell wall biosynthesis
MALHAIVLTLNEEKHLARCLESVAAACDSILVVDSGSKDRTVEIARRYGATVLQNRFVNYATQLNFAIARLAGRGGWLLRIDADEVLLADPATVRQALEAAGPSVDGLLVRRRMHFMGRAITWGGMDPIWQLRLWREGRGTCEQRWMDEHVIVHGDVARTSIRIDDINQKTLSWWTDKHNSYATREAIDILARRHGLFAIESVARARGVDQVVVKRALKDQLYLRLPPGLRSSLYFLYRYVLRAGFLDGRPGWYFHVLQGFWYRTLVDAKVQEIEQHARERGVPVIEAIVAVTGVDPRPAAGPRAATAPKAAAASPVNHEDERVR